MDSNYTLGWLYRKLNSSLDDKQDKRMKLTLKVNFS